MIKARTVPTGMLKERCLLPFGSPAGAVVGFGARGWHEAGGVVLWRRLEGLMLIEVFGGINSGFPEGVHT